MKNSTLSFVLDNYKLPNPLRSSGDFQSWLKENQKAIEEKMASQGAILFRNFPLSTAQEFQDCMTALKGEDSFFSYAGGTSPRTAVAENVYTSTNMPFFSPIPFHSEMVYQKTFPKKVVFFCRQPPLLGGCTPFSDNRKVYTDLQKDLSLADKPETIIYFRRLKSSTPLKKFMGRFYPLILTQTWQTLFATNDKLKVEDFYRQTGTPFAWQKDNSLLLQTELPRGLESIDPQSGVWLNSMHFFQLHQKIWGYLPTMIFKLVKFFLNEPYDNAVWKDGTPLTSRDIHHILRAFEKNSYRLSWKQGDLLILNNVLMSHGRDPYIGRRKIWVGLIGATEIP